MRTSVKRAGTAVAGAAAAVAYAGPVRRWMRTWGATPDELARTFPGDDILPDAVELSTRAISIRATPAEIWPHLQDVGDWRRYFERLLARIPGANKGEGALPEARREVHEGDEIPTGISVIRVVHVDPQRAIVMRHTGPGYDYTWATVLEPEGPDRTRLIAHTRYKGIRALLAALDPFIFMGIRRFFSTVRRRAEADAARRALPSPGAGPTLPS